MGREQLRERVFDPAKRRAELDEIIFHDLRHTYASLLIAASVQPTVAAEQLGDTDARRRSASGTGTCIRAPRRRLRWRSTCSSGGCATVGQAFVALYGGDEIEERVSADGR